MLDPLAGIQREIQRAEEQAQLVADEICPMG
jgi:hypothetical protein